MPRQMPNLSETECLPKYAAMTLAFKRRLWKSRRRTLTPYDYWRRTHAIRHVTSGNLERRGIGDVQSDRVTRHEGW